MAADSQAFSTQTPSPEGRSCCHPPEGNRFFVRIKEIVECRRGWVLLLIILLGLSIRLAGLVWGQAYCYFAQGDSVEAYFVAMKYSAGEARSQYLGQPNYNEKSKLPGPLWTIFCFLGLRLGGSINGLITAIILLNTAAIYLTYKLADVTIGSRASLWAALICATQPWAVYYSVLVYNPDVMAFLSGLFSLALWDVTQRPKSRNIFWACWLLMIMPQFHMSGLMLVPAALVVVVISGARLHVPWLIAGVVAGGLMYVPYLQGELAHGWQNTIGMFSGHEKHSWEGLKALSAPLSFLVSWAPRWTRSAGEYRELGRACFGSFGAFLAFSLLSGLVAVFLLAGAFLKIKAALNGFWESPRRAFSRSPGVLFLFIVVAVPILIGLISRKAFHTRYCLVFLPALLSLAGCAVGELLPYKRVGHLFGGALILTIAGNVWFMPAMYHYQGTCIERGPTFVPSFGQLESVYRQLKKDAGETRRIEVVVDKDYLRKLPSEDKLYRDAAIIRTYVVAREYKPVSPANAQEVPVIYKLCHGGESSAGNGRIAYQARGIMITSSAHDE
jgi:hypothetical protein